MKLIPTNFKGYLPSTGEGYNVKTKVSYSQPDRCWIFTAICRKDDDIGTLVDLKCKAFNKEGQNWSFEDAAREALQELSDKIGVQLIKLDLKQV